MSQPRVFYVGETVPPAVCVLNELGEVFYLDETGQCDDCDRWESCPECSYEVTNGTLGPLVEVLVPDYAQAVAVEDARRRKLAASGPARGGVS